ncbi:MAG: hypothetical protein V4760_14325 [Bdellovibrionota bacterium]
MGTQSLYHFKPIGMVGDVLIPLNELKATLPEVYSEQVKKYEGREKLLEKKIPILDCLWNDVLHFSPVNPQKIIDIWRERDWLRENTRSRLPIAVYRVPIELLKHEPIVCFQSFSTEPGKYDPSQDKFWRFEASGYEEHDSVPAKQIEVWESDFKADRRFFWYSHTMHVLARQRIDTRECELISCE